MKVSHEVLQSAVKTLASRTGKTLEIVQGYGGYSIVEITCDGTQNDFLMCGKQSKKVLFDIINVYMLAASRTKEALTLAIFAHVL